VDLMRVMFWDRTSKGYFVVAQNLTQEKAVAYRRQLFDDRTLDGEFWLENEPERLNDDGNPVQPLDTGRVWTSDIIDAYEEFDGDDLGAWQEAWDRYLAGTDTPCRSVDGEIYGDGIHQVTDGSCDRCGAKNRESE
jgi:hypothetical protein